MSIQEEHRKLLASGQSYQVQVPDGGDLASMRAILKHGQILTISPIASFDEIQVGDIVLVRWRGQSNILHVISEIQGDQFLIVNSLGKINGWVHGRDVLGRVTQIIEPEPQPGLYEMFELMGSSYQRLAERLQLSQAEICKLDSILEDLRWYAERYGPERREKLPRQNRWSFTQIVWYLTRQARDASQAELTGPVEPIIDQGKTSVGWIAENLGLFETDSHKSKN